MSGGGGVFSLECLEEGAVSIVEADFARDVTYYVILVALKTGESWKVARRYNEFKDLHEKLMSMFSIASDSGLLQLPPKRIFNNNDKHFIKKRQTELQEYLRSVIINFVPPCPQPLRVFLTENTYDFRDVESVVMTTSKSTASTPWSYAFGPTPSRPSPSRLSGFGDDRSSDDAPSTQLDAFGMPAFVGGASQRDSGKTSGSVSTSVSSWYPDVVGDGGRPFTTFEGGDASWFDGNADAPNGGSVRMISRSLPVTSGVSPGVVNADLKAFLSPRFPQLHSKIKNQIQEAFEKSKVARGITSTVFVDDLISF